MLASYTYSYLETQPTLKTGPTTHDWPVACGLTSITLIFVGFRGVFGKAYRELDRGHRSLAEEQLASVQKESMGRTIRRIAERLLAVGLPFYATSKLGAARVALIMLLGLASNIVAIEDEATDLTKVKTWKMLFAYRRWTVGSILLQLICDLSGLTNGSSSTSICLGYTALALSILVLPPAFPSSRPKASVVTAGPTPETSTSAVLPNPWQTLPNPDIASKVPKISSLICSPKDSELTLLSGTILGILSIITFMFLGPASGYLTATQLGWSSLTALAAAISLTSTETRSLRSNKSLGLVVGSLISLFMLAQRGMTLWSSLAYQSVFIGVSFVSTNLDTRAAFSTSSHSTHQHHHATDSHIAEHAQMSRFSEFVLRNAPKNQLLHSILVEKDSRRILYFMW